jgi:hypothetical protein
LLADPVAGGAAGMGRERVIMRFTQRGVIVISVALAGLAPAATAMATPLASAGRGPAAAAQSCGQVTATIRVGRTVSVITPCRN